MTGIQSDAERTLLRQVDRSLQEWGRWSRSGGSPNLGYPRESLWTKVRGSSADWYDFQRIEEVEQAWTTWKTYTMLHVHGDQRRHNLMLLFMLKIHYCEDGAVYDKVHHTSRKFHRKLSRSEYYLLLKEARLKLATLIY